MELIDEDLTGMAIHSDTMNAVITMRSPQRQVTSPSDVVVKNLQTNKVAYWGEADNLFPQQVITDIEENDVIDPILNWKARELVGGGVSYGNLVHAGDGAQVLEPLSIPEIDDWMDNTAFGKFAMESALDLYTYYNANAEMHVGPTGRINGLFSQDQSWLRLKENDRKGDITTAWLCADWSQCTNVNDKKTVITLPALDPYFNVPGQIASLSPSNSRFILPMRYQTRGRKYYALAPWNPLRVNGALTLAKAIITSKNSIVKHTMNTGTQIEVADGYWSMRFGKQWEEAKNKPEVKRKLMLDEVKRWENTLSGEKNAGKSIFTRMLQMQHTNELISMVKFTPLKSALPDGALVEDSAEIDHHIIRALGVDPTLPGLSPSKNRQSGSGSDKRVARTNYLLGERPHGQLLLGDTMAIVSEVNGWNKKYNKGRPIRFRYTNLYAATLDRTNKVDAKPNQEKQTDNGAD